MATRFLAFMLCQRRMDRAFLCVRQERSPCTPFSFLSVETQDEALIQDQLQQKALSFLYLQLFRSELTLPSKPLNGDKNPAIVVCKSRILLDARTASLVERRAVMEIEFFSLDEMRQMSGQGSLDPNAVAIAESFA